MGRDDRLVSTLDDGALGGEVFELAPVSLWLQDHSAVLALFEQWRQAGVRSLAAYFAEDSARLRACIARVRVVRVNKHTLEMFGAATASEFLGSLDGVSMLEEPEGLASEFIQLWEGRRRFVRKAVTRTLSGQRLDIMVTGTVLPGHEQTLDRILVALHDITEQEAAIRRQAVSERYARGLFDYSPVSLWVEDFTAIKRLLDEVRARGITDFRTFLDVHEEFVERCVREIRIIDVNDHTLDLFGAPDRPTLFARMSEILRDKVHVTFKDQLAELWEGKLNQQREITTYTLNGDELYMHFQLSVFPGYEDDWGVVQVALTDITARKKAEAYLEFLGKHDDLTKLSNRSFYVDEIRRLGRKRQFPVSVIIIDMNGLKRINDRSGHFAGDDMLRRLGEVLAKAIDPPAHACRIGGDEFAVLMPYTDEAGAEAMLQQIDSLIHLNNQFHSDEPLLIAAGCGTVREGEQIEDAVRRADERMYEAKRAFYRESGHERRHGHERVVT
jgi:diguanylate cyclase (GGDEF)-like protein